jgi:hypothetical protein
MRKIVGLLLGASLVAIAHTASAAGSDFGSSGTFAFGIERAFGFYGYRASYAQDWPGGRVEASDSGSMFNLLIGGSGIDRAGAAGGLSVNPFAMPRVAFDYFVANSWSVGGSLGYVHTSGRYRMDSGPPGTRLDSHDLADVDVFAIAPRGGYCYMFNSIIGIWPRLGFTYAHWGSDAWADDGYKSSGYVFDVNVEVMFPIVPVQHVAILVGPLVDIPVAGNSSTEYRAPPALLPPDTSVHLWNYGLAVGLLGYL